jgi:hypothetical protein
MAEAPVLYQGTTSVVPKSTKESWALAPEVQLFEMGYLA